MKIYTIHLGHPESSFYEEMAKKQDTNTETMLTNLLTKLFELSSKGKNQNP